MLKHAPNCTASSTTLRTAPASCSRAAKACLDSPTFRFRNTMPPVFSRKSSNASSPKSRRTPRMTSLALLPPLRKRTRKKCLPKWPFSPHGTSRFSSSWKNSVKAHLIPAASSVGPSPNSPNLCKGLKEVRLQGLRTGCPSLPLGSSPASPLTRKSTSTMHSVRRSGAACGRHTLPRLTGSGTSLLPSSSLGVSTKRPCSTPPLR